MSRKRTPPLRPVAEVTPLNYTPKVGAVRHLTLTLPNTPKVGAVRHLTLTLPNSQYSYGGMRKIDTTVTLSADEADDLAAKLTQAAAELRARA